MFEDQAPPNLPTDEPQKPKGPVADEPKQRKTPPPAIPAKAPAPKSPTANAQPVPQPSSTPATPKPEIKVGASDMFAGLDTGPTPAPPKQPAEGAVQPTRAKGGLLKTIIIIVVSILVLGFAAYGLWWLITTMTSPGAEIDIQEPEEEGLVEDTQAVEDQIDEEEEVEDVIVDIPDPVVETTPSKDSDGDGLSDIQEAQIGTSPTSTDTDVDQLSDYDEVMLYKSNPLDPDTDNDSYLDGEEVNNGYNPNGTGKLFQIPRAEDLINS